MPIGLQDQALLQPSTAGIKTHEAARGISAAVGYSRVGTRGNLPFWRIHMVKDGMQHVYYQCVYAFSFEDNRLYKILPLAVLFPS